VVNTVMVAIDGSVCFLRGSVGHLALASIPTRATVAPESREIADTVSGVPDGDLP
jgi:hypothetical protein